MLYSSQYHYSLQRLLILIHVQRGIVMWWKALLLTVVALVSCVQGNKTDSRTGVVFSPYTRHKENGTFPKWSVTVYSGQEVRAMLEVISRNFSQIATYGVGAGLSGSWEDGDAIGLTAYEAAKINRDTGDLRLQVWQGIWTEIGKDNYQFKDDLSKDILLNNEVRNAFNVSRTANSVFSDTVDSIVFSAELVDSSEASRMLNEFIQQVKAHNPDYGKFYQIGVRSPKCRDVLDRKRPEDANGTPIVIANRTSFFNELLVGLDFAICKIFPSAKTARLGPREAALKMTAEFERIKNEFLAINPKMEVIWETGWPSAGESDNGSKNTDKNLHDYWKFWSDLTVKNKRRVFLHEAFDQPWKVDENDTRFCEICMNGAASHFGLWKRTSNDDISVNAYQEKIPEEEIETTERVQLPWTIIALVISCLALIFVLPISIVTYRWKVAKVIKKRLPYDKLTELDILEFEKGGIMYDLKSQNYVKAGYEGPLPKSTDICDIDLWSRPYDSSFEISRDNLVVDQSVILGKGEFGTVFRGELKGSNAYVAVKSPHQGTCGAYVKTLLAEIKVMTYLEGHANVLKFLGAHTSSLRQGVLFLVFEFCHGGNLENKLRTCAQQVRNAQATANSYVPFSNYVQHSEVNLSQDQNSNTVPLDKLKKWSYEVACGMNHLASKKVIHGDLATRNVLIGDNDIAKVSDFGLSRRLYEYSQYVKMSEEVALPWRWLAPESLRTLTFSTQTDVWAFGVTLWEIFSLGDLPFPTLCWNGNFVNHLEQGLRLSQPNHASLQMYQLMLECWTCVPEARPDFHQLKEMLNPLNGRM